MMLTSVIMISPQQIRAAAVVAEVDPRTVRRFLAGEPIRDLSRERLERACARLGLIPASPSAPEVDALHDREPVL